MHECYTIATARKTHVLEVTITGQTTTGTPTSFTLCLHWWAVIDLIRALVKGWHEERRLRYNIIQGYDADIRRAVEGREDQ